METDSFGYRVEAFVDLGTTDFDCPDKVVLLNVVLGCSLCCSSNPCIVVYLSSSICIGCFVDCMPGYNFRVVLAISIDIWDKCFDSKGTDLLVADKIDMDSLEP